MACKGGALEGALKRAGALIRIAISDLQLHAPADGGSNIAG